MEKSWGSRLRTAAAQFSAEHEMDRIHRRTGVLIERAIQVMLSGRSTRTWSIFGNIYDRVAIAPSNHSPLDGILCPTFLMAGKAVHKALDAPLEQHAYRTLMFFYEPGGFGNALRIRRMGPA